VCVQVFFCFSGRRILTNHVDTTRTDVTKKWWQVCSFTSLLLLFFLRFSFSRFLWRCLTLLVLCLGLLRFVRLVEAVVKKVLPTKDKVLSLYVLLPKVENRQRRSSPFSQKAMHVLLQLSPHCMSSTFTKLQYCCCEVEEVYSLNGSK
jgi:hypothetical protein